MCIICVKKAGIEFPNEMTIRTMYRNNPDGAGYMYTLDGNVIIRKGFMTCDGLIDSLEALKEKQDLTALPMVLHFRIGTAGGNIPANTHPFPLTDNLHLLQKERVKCNVGIVHNGIIDIKTSRTDISDTMEYIQSQLSVLSKISHDFYKTVQGQKLIYNFAKSKFAFLNSKGEIYTIGDFTEVDGLEYSNSSYLNRSYALQDYTKYYKSLYDDAGYEYDDAYFDTYDTYKAKSKNVSIWRNLLPLDEKGAYIRTNGELLECDDDIYYMDSHYRVYRYDWDDDKCIALNGIATAYKYSGDIYQFNYGQAEYLETIG